MSQMQRDNSMCFLSCSTYSSVELHRVIICKHGYACEYMCGIEAEGGLNMIRELERTHPSETEY